MQRQLFILIAIAVISMSCQKTDPANVPAYIYIPEFIIDSTQEELNIYSHNISDVWIYLDNDNQGAYELPALFPIAETGNHLLEIRPGIKNAGISNQRRPYPYYTLTSINMNLKAGKTDTIIPVIGYDNEIRTIFVPWEEQFESIGANYDINPNSDTSLQIVDVSEQPELVFRDLRSGAIFMDESGYFFEMVSPTLLNLPRNNIPIYLEINYKSNQDFICGIYRYNKSEQIPIYIVKSKDEWNKIYLDLSEYIQSSPPGTDFNIYIGFTRNPSTLNVEMFLDNIKLIHY